MSGHALKVSPPHFNFELAFENVKCLIFLTIDVFRCSGRGGTMPLVSATDLRDSALNLERDYSHRTDIVERSERPIAGSHEYQLS